MNTLSQPQHGPVKRKIHYVDHAIQKWLLVALVTLELLLVGAAVWVLYQQLSAVVEQNLYRIHYSDGQRIFPVLLENSLYVLGGLIAANLAALLVADRIWAHYVNGILRSFKGLMTRTEGLDFLDDGTDITRQHEVIELALAWREAEHARCRKIREEIGGLDASQKYADPEVREKAKAALERLRRALP